MIFSLALARRAHAVALLVASERGGLTGCTHASHPPFTADVDKTLAMPVCFITIDCCCFRAADASLIASGSLPITQHPLVVHVTVVLA